LSCDQRLVPDLTIVLDFPVADGIERVSLRGSHDRIEQSAIDFHERVEHAFVESTKPEWQKLHPDAGPSRRSMRAARARTFLRECSRRW
jgi:dTMP kinase